MFRLFLICGAVLTAIGCASGPKPAATPAAAPGTEPLRATNRVYIAMPEDAVYKRETVPDSGRRTTLALQNAFQRHTRFVTIARVPEPLPDVLARARDFECDFVAFPTILKWEDHLTEWTAVRDRLELKIEILAANSGQVVRATTISARSKFMTDGEDAPQELLADPVDKFVRSLYRITYVPTALQR